MIVSIEKNEQAQIWTPFELIELAANLNIELSTDVKASKKVKFSSSPAQTFRQKPFECTNTEAFRGENVI